MRSTFRIFSSAALTLCFFLCRFAAAQDVTSPTPLGTLVEAGGYRVHLYCTGTGTPTVVVAGAAFSFDWALVQGEVARFTKVCTYDPSGTAWSDSYRPLHESGTGASFCSDRALEVHRMLQNASVPGPYVLVGFSFGGLIGRTYAHLYPADLAGFVIVDHALTDVDSDVAAQPSVSSGSKKDQVSSPNTLVNSVDSPPILISSSPITFDLEDDQNFLKLPERDRRLHRWAMSLHPLRPSARVAAECLASLETATSNEPHPLGNKPLVVIRTNNTLPAYDRLQKRLLSLSQNSKLVLAPNSSHMVILDEPEIVTGSIWQVVEAVKQKVKLSQ